MSKGVILVVDDELASLRLLADSLRAEGYRVLPANSGELALSSLATTAPGLILLDVRMPGMDGFEVMRRIKAREDAQAIPVMFLSAATEIEYRVEGFRLGAMDFITKPFEREELLARVHTHLELFRLRTDLERRAADLQLINEKLLRDELTERKQTEAELRRSNAELEQFSYAISHDMRQPLRMITSYLQLLGEGLAGKLDAQKREYLNFAADGARRLDKMLVDLLEYSRVGRKGEPPDLVESRAVLDEALLFLQPAIDEANAEMRVEGDWPRISGRPDEILRLLQNLIGNAVKFRVAGRMPVVIVASEVVDGQWRLSVADNGAGIIPDQIERLFQVFQRLHSRGDYEGTGIGLALCRRIVEHHGGNIRAESAGQGRGSRFCVTLPLEPEAPSCRS